MCVCVVVWGTNEQNWFDILMRKNSRKEKSKKRKQKEEQLEKRAGQAFGESQDGGKIVAGE